MNKMLNEKIIDKNYRQNTYSICGFFSKTERFYKKKKKKKNMKGLKKFL